MSKEKTEHQLKGCRCPKGSDIRFCLDTPQPSESSPVQEEGGKDINVPTKQLAIWFRWTAFGWGLWMGLMAGVMYSDHINRQCELSKLEMRIERINER